MALDKIVLAQTILYFCTFICGFLVSIPIGRVTNTIMEGHCILYADVKKVDNIFVPTFGDLWKCEFPIYLSVVGCILYSLGVGIYHAIVLHMSRSKKGVGSQMLVIPFVVLNCLLTLLLLISSCIVTVGFSSFCSEVTEHTEGLSCEIVLKLIAFIQETGDIYELFSLAKISSWICFLLLLAQAIIGVIRFIINRREANSH